MAVLKYGTWSDETDNGPGQLLDLLAHGWPAWHARAACRTAPLDVNFFPERGEDSRPAVAICSGCPVIAACRAWAVAQGSELQGIWGGLSGNGRQQTRRAA
jgi:WhiB family redox-sensing transcriptional regulator